MWKAEARKNSMERECFVIPKKTQAFEFPSLTIGVNVCHVTVTFLHSKLWNIL